jgi:hypothetical protein
MLVSSRVPLAFFGADFAGVGTHVQQLQENLLVASSASRCQRACRKTNIGAIHVETDALSQFTGRRLGTACVRAAQAGQHTVVALLYATNEGVTVLAPRLRMGLDDLPGLHLSPLSPSLRQMERCADAAVFPAEDDLIIRQPTARRRVQVSATSFVPAGLDAGRTPA